jgi:phenylalanyl-tRNA synthetase beta chain
MAVKIEGIEIKDSPEWLKERLIAVNQKPINNIVDLTNYIMLDCGQPLHAFCAEKIKKIIVRRAKKNENFETLDEKERILTEEDIVITDGAQVIALAGVMGGKNSGITNSTKNIILEAANFNARSIRKTSQRLGLRTEASARFEKSLDPNLCETALFRFLTILKEICPSAHISSSLIDVRQAKESAKIIILDLEWLTKKIGQEIPKEWVIKTLKNLGFSIVEDKRSELSVEIPSWRGTKDISGQEDLIEEVLRIYGYNKISSQLPFEILSLPEVNQERQIERKIKNILALKHGLSEVYNYSFLSDDQLKKLNIDSSNYLRLANPLSDIQTILRQTLAPGLVNNIKNNQHKADSLGFFEIGSVFSSMLGTIKKEINNDDTIPYQEKHLGLVIAGDEKDLFTELKGIVNNLFQILIDYNLEIQYLVAEDAPGWADLNKSAKINIFGKEIGILAVVNQETINNFNLKKEVAIAEINLYNLLELILNVSSINFQEGGKYPTVVRDLAFVLNKKILYNEFKSEISKFNSLIKNVELFDIYTGENILENEKSLAFHLTFQADEKTLTTSEIDLLVEALLKYLEEKYGAKLRS